MMYDVFHFVTRVDTIMIFREVGVDGRVHGTREGVGSGEMGREKWGSGNRSEGRSDAGPRGGRRLDPSFWTFFSSSALAEVHCAFHMKNR